MNPEKIRQAFDKAKEDIYNLYYNYQYLETELAGLKSLIEKQNQELQEIKANIREHNVSFNLLKRTLDRQTHRQANIDTPSFPVDTSTDTSTVNYPLEAVKSSNSVISTRNKGVSTDRQTHRQTDNRLNQASKVIETINEIKEEVRIKFQALTSTEMKVFAILYQLEEQGLVVDYQLLSQYLQITESSIRDHIGKIIKKGVPVEKTKENNKKIILKISKNLKELASLETIQKLRDI